MRELLDSIELSLVRKLSEKCNSGTLRLGLGEPQSPLSDELRELFIKQMEKPITIYSPTDGLPVLKNELAEIYQNEFGKENLNVCITSGSMQALYMTLGASSQPGEGIISIEPRYPGYATLFHLFGLQPTYVQRGIDGRLPAEEILDAIDENTRFILLNSPNNPTGCIDSRDDLEHLFSGLANTGIKVILDEVYYGFSTEEFFSPFSYPNTILIRGISKTYGLTGFRLGWAVTDDKVLGSRLKKFQQNINTCPNTIVQYFTLELLRDDRGRTDYLKSLFLRGREFVRDFCSTKGLKTYPMDGAFYAYMSLEGTRYEDRSLDFGMDILEKENVLVVPGCSFTPDTNNFFRINVLLEEEVLKEAFARMSKLLF